MEQLAKIEELISPPGTLTSGSVLKIEGSRIRRLGAPENTMLIYDIETIHGVMTIPADWLAKLMNP